MLDDEDYAEDDEEGDYIEDDLSEVEEDIVERNETNDDDDVDIQDLDQLPLLSEQHADVLDNQSEPTNTRMIRSETQTLSSSSIDNPPSIQPPQSTSRSTRASSSRSQPAIATTSQSTRTRPPPAFYKGKNGQKWYTTPPNADSNSNLPPVRFLTNNFSLGPKLKDTVNSISSVAGFFDYFFDSALLTFLVKYTNTGIAEEDQHVTLEEIRAFIGILCFK